jgi:hypothetical protein
MGGSRGSRQASDVGQAKSAAGEEEGAPGEGEEGEDEEPGGHSNGAPPLQPPYFTIPAAGPGSSGSPPISWPEPPALVTVEYPEPELPPTPPPPPPPEEGELVS